MEIIIVSLCAIMSGLFAVHAMMRARKAGREAGMLRINLMNAELDVENLRDSRLATVRANRKLRSQVQRLMLCEAELNAIKQQRIDALNVGRAKRGLPPLPSPVSGADAAAKQGG